MANIIDLILVGIVVIFAFIGMNRGAIKTVLDLFGWIMSIILSLIIVRYVGGFILNIGAINNLVVGESGSLASVLHGIIPAFGGVTVGASEQEISAALGNNIMNLIVPHLSNFLAAAKDGGYVGLTLQTAISQFFAVIIYYAILGLIVFILIRVIFGRMEKAVDNIRKQNVIKSLDNVAGFFVGALKGLVIASIALVVFALMINMPILSGVKEAFEQTRIANKVAQFLLSIISRFIDLNGIFAKIIPGMAI